MAMQKTEHLCYRGRLSRRYITRQYALNYLDFELTEISGSNIVRNLHVKTGKSSVLQATDLTQPLGVFGISVQDAEFTPTCCRSATLPCLRLTDALAHLASLAM